MKRLLLATAAALVLGFSASGAAAQWGYSNMYGGTYYVPPAYSYPNYNYSYRYNYGAYPSYNYRYSYGSPSYG